MWTHQRLSVLLISFVLLCVLGTLPGYSQIHYEGFDTTDFKDPINTTADWNTTDGELKRFPFTYSLLGSYDTPGNAKGVRIAGFLAIVADGGAGLQVIDVWDPADPSLEYTYDTPGSAEDVFVCGSYFYVADGSGGLQILYISQYGTVSQVGSINLSGSSRGIFVAGHYAYVAGDFSGLQVIDISDPASPSLVGTYNTPGAAYDVFVSGNYAFVADASSGLQVVDISTPASPALSATFSTTGIALGVEVSGDHAYLAAHSSGLQVIDITDPTAPTSAGTLVTPGYAWSVSVAGDFAYIADAGSGLQVVDISDPALPVSVGSYDTAGSAYGVIVEGNCAYVGDYAGGLRIIDISDPSYLTEVGQAITPGSAFDLDISGNHAYMADGPGGLQVVDISDPSGPQLVGSFSTGDYAQDVSVSGNYAYVAVTGGDMQVIDISDPTSPFLAASPPTGNARAIDVSGDYAYVDEQYFGLGVIDITTPTAPVQVGSLSVPYGVVDIQVVGALAYVVDGFSALHVIDVSDPTNPLPLGSYVEFTATRSLFVWGRFAFVADEVQGLIMLDVASPTSIGLVESLATPGSANGVFVSGDRIYVVDSEEGLTVIEINDLGSLEIVGNDHLAGYNESIIVTGDYAYIAGSGGLRVIQVQQRDWDTDNNKAQSLVFDDSEYDVASVIVSCSGWAAIDLELSADNGGNWHAVRNESEWVQLTAGSDLLWRSAHRVTAGNGAISFLDVSYRYVCGPITAVSDVPDDQGGWIRVTFGHSGYDIAGASPQVATGYWVHQRVDDPALAARVMDSNASGAKIDPELAALGDVLLMDDRTFIASRDKAEGFPPGLWEVVGSVPAMQQASYNVRVPTLADSTATDPVRSIYLVTTHTTDPEAWFASLPDSGYSVDNIAPGVPQGMSAAYASDGVSLDWDDATETDFQFFRIYRGTEAGFIPSPANLVHETAVSAWNDPTTDPWGFHYKITVLDHAGNEGEAGSPGYTSSIQENALPSRTALLGAIPNPFNPSTKLSFELASTGHVILKVFDTSGRLVATLVDGHRQAGWHDVVWDGRDGSGRMSSAGVYLYRLETKGHLETRRMTLLK